MPRGVRRTAEEAEQLLASLHYSSVEPFPGSKHQWRVRCERCGGELTVMIRHLTMGRRPCRPCELARAVRDLALYDLLAAGEFTTARAPWAVTCRRCGWNGTVVLETAG